MRLPLKDLELGAAMDQIPLKDISRFIGASLRTSGSDASLRPGLSEVIGAIQPEAGLFALEDGNEPLATLICVHDGDLAGLFEVATEKSARKQGHGRNLILSALKWARLRGAREAWLQVEAGNLPALSLYRSLGFEEVYRYHYRRPPGA
jgi:ribosomal protein S18 acetylase RimI-like enzyme